jgi:hypothetical protein
MLHPSYETPPVRPEVAMTTILIGFGVTLIALVIQGAAATVGVELIGVLITKKRWLGIHLWRNGVVTMALIVILLTGHFGQMALWASVFMAAGEFQTFAAAFYHSAVNYTTLGYGDIVMSEEWRLLGPQEAVSGTLAFGWSTAAIVTIVIRLFRDRHLTLLREDSRGPSQETRDPTRPRQ